MISKSELKSSGGRSFGEKEEYEFAFQFWHCEPSVKNQWGKRQKTFFYFIFCLGLAEIASFLFLVLFKDGGRRGSPKLNLFISDVNQGIKDAGWVEDLLA